MMWNGDYVGRDQWKVETRDSNGGVNIIKAIVYMHENKLKPIILHN
jgi:hypothetical protein